MRPEMIVRRMIHGMGYRYRLHRQDLPGRPDIVFPSRRKVIFVNGCFWHQHNEDECRLARKPKSRQDYWLPKLERNVARDQDNWQVLKKEGWEVLVVWECAINREGDKLKRLLRAFMER